MVYSPNLKQFLTVSGKKTMRKMRRPKSQMSLFVGESRRLIQETENREENQNQETENIEENQFSNDRQSSEIKRLSDSDEQLVPDEGP